MEQQNEVQVTGEQIPEVTKRQLQTDVKALESGSLIGSTLTERYRIAKAYYQGGMVPKSYKSAEQVMAGMQFAIELGLQPLTGLRNIAVINGNPSLWGDLPLALVRKSGKLVSIQEKIFDEEDKEINIENPLGKPYLSVCETARKNEDGTISKMTTFFTMDDAKRAGLLGRDNVWQTYPRRMLQMRARSQNLKDHFGDILLGASIAEYDYNYQPSENEFKDVTPQGEEIRNPSEELLKKE